MLAYAANRPQFAARPPSPRTLILVIAVHIAAVVVLLSMKTDLPQAITHQPINIRLLRDTPPPPEHVLKPSTPRPQPEITQTETLVPPLRVPVIDSNPKLPDIRDLIGPSIPPTANVEPRPVVPPAPTLARLLTPQSELRPPYPESKLLTGEETTLNLRLTIDEQGRVVDVAAIGAADRVFLEAARRYLIAHWRYKPATSDGRPIESNLAITLRFELD
jgi:protein TonB